MVRKNKKERICQDPLKDSEKKDAIWERRVEENPKDDYEMEDIPIQEEKLYPLYLVPLTLPLRLH